MVCPKVGGGGLKPTCAPPHFWKWGHMPPLPPFSYALVLEHGSLIYSALALKTVYLSNKKYLLACNISLHGKLTTVRIKSVIFNDECTTLIRSKVSEVVMILHMLLAKMHILPIIKGYQNNIKLQPLKVFFLNSANHFVYIIALYD